MVNKVDEYYEVIFFIQILDETLLNTEKYDGFASLRGRVVKE